MAIYIPDKQLLFLQTPGTASTAVGNALKASRGAVILGDKHDSLESLLSKGRLNEAALAETTVCCCVRNPFDWLVSEWFRLKTRYVWELKDPNSLYATDFAKREEVIAACALDFNDWLQYIYYTLYELDKRDGRCLFEYWTTDVDMVFKVEELPRLIDFLERRLSMSIKVEKVNVTKGKERPYWCYYSESARATVERLFCVTLKKYNYWF
jgi:hypothetical protein